MEIFNLPYLQSAGLVTDQYNSDDYFIFVKKDHTADSGYRNWAIKATDVIPAGANFYTTIEDNGTALIQRAVLNFTGTGFTITDTGGKTTINFTTPTALWIPGAGTNSLVANNGSTSTATGDYAVSEGFETTADGDYAHAEGSNTYANGLRTHAEGYYTTAVGANSHAEGSLCTANGANSHVQGSGCMTSGVASHAGGVDSTASGAHAFVHGDSSIASGIGTIVLGDGITGTEANTVYLQTLRLNPMTTATKNAITAANGMLVYDSTLNKFQGYENGAWVNLV